jgi:hypothetical protein
VSVDQSELHPVAATNPLFKAILLFVAVLCISCLVGQGLLAALAADPMTKAQESFASMSMHGFMTTLALFIGLAGGRAGHTDYFGQPPQAGVRSRRRATKTTTSPVPPPVTPENS